MAALISRCTAETLSLFHELRVDSSRLSSGSDFFSSWFRPPQGDADRHWRLHLSRHSSEQWALHLQLASSDELGSLLRRQPRLVPDPDRPPACSQTNYILTAASVHASLNAVRGSRAHCLRQVREEPRTNFRAYGYLDTLRNYLVCYIPAWTDADADRDLHVRLKFQVEYHNVTVTDAAPDSTEMMGLITPSYRQH